MESRPKVQEDKLQGAGIGKGSDSAKFWPADPELALICGQCQIVSPSTKQWPLLAADGDPGESDDDPGMDELAEEMMKEPINLVHPN